MNLPVMAVLALLIWIVGAGMKAVAGSPNDDFSLPEDDSCGPGPLDIY